MSSISLSYQGALADNNVLDMYDASRGLVGFQRSLALIARPINTMPIPRFSLDFP
jgi:hypothetical protein